MKFKYRKEIFPSSEAFPDIATIHRPVIPVTAIWENKRRSLIALVDTGADVCIFESDIGKDLGIPIMSGKPLILMGISQGVVEVFFHTIILEIGGYQFESYVAFSYSIPRSILGQYGFLDKFNVWFSQESQSLEIKPISTALSHHK